MIKWTNASLKFKDKEIFKDLDLQIKKGDKVLITNRSGSGKSTLIKSAIGFIPLNSGTIEVDGLELLPENIFNIRKKIFYLDQDVTLPELPIETLIYEITTYKGNNNLNIAKSEFLDLMVKLELNKDYLKKNIKELSGGERQRIGIIIGLLLKRPIWFLDEPTSALDKDLKNRVVELVKKENITAIVISHDDCWQSEFSPKEVNFL